MLELPAVLLHLKGLLNELELAAYRMQVSSDLNKTQLLISTPLITVAKCWVQCRSHVEDVKFTKSKFKNKNIVFNFVRLSGIY